MVLFNLQNSNNLMIKVTNSLFFMHFMSYWLISFYFLCKDLLVKISVEKQIKYCERDNIFIPIDFKLYTKAIFVSLYSQLIILYPLIFIFSHFYTFYEFNLQQTIASLILAIIFEELIFYTLHRLLHTKWLWKYHSMHHELISPVAVGTLYASWVENLFCNFIPIVIMPMFVKMSYELALFWTFLTTVSAVSSHCGFKSLKQLTEFHSLHHLYKSYNYGTNGLLDIIFRTYKQ